MHMKTTVEIPDALFREAKRYAAAHELTFREVVEAGLRRVVQPAANKNPFKLRDCTFKGDGMVKNFTWDEIMEIIYEGRGGAG
jgi:hypothetical protein